MAAITEAMARCDKSESLYRIRAKMFCDCTGDSRLGLEAGADMRTGREARSEYGEPLAPAEPDNRTLGSSILFTSRLYHEAMPFTPPSWARKISKQQLLHRKIDTWEYGYWWIEWGGDKDIITDNERIRYELLAIVMGIWDYIKNSGDFPDSRNWAMDWVGMMPGKRGSRRLLGDHVLTQQDLMQSDFPDGVAIGGWAMDAHPPEGFDRPDLPPNTTLRPPEVYPIPLRSIYSRNISNLLMAGRNISASYMAFTSSRVMATCAVIGQAAGTAAAQCIESGILPRELAGSSKHVEQLQQTLLRDDQTIKNARNRDVRDVARQASVIASAEKDNAKAALVIDGFARDVPDKRGDPMEVHQWAAPVSDGNPAWIELQWPKPQRIRQVQLTFDSGFRRQLTLSAQNSVNNGIKRAAQPETVKDYAVIGHSPDGAKHVLANVKGNFQRLNRHQFEPMELTSLRIEVQATNGDSLARIFEIRCYA